MMFVNAAATLKSAYPTLNSRRDTTFCTENTTMGLELFDLKLMASASHLSYLGRN